jgi:diguanylate cyclase (GGDEF)-like protein
VDVVEGWADARARRRSDGRQPWSSRRGLVATLRLAVVGFVAMAVYVALSGATAEIWFQAVAWASLGLFGFGVHRNRVRSVAWAMVGGGFLLFVVGDLLFTLNEFVLHVDTFPSSADVAYLAGYPVLAIGLAALIRRSGRSHSALIDAGIVITPVAVAGFVYVVQPTAAFGVTFVEKAVSGAYPVGDLVCLAVLVRIVAGLGHRDPGRRGGLGQPALGVLITALAALLAGDIIFLSTTLTDSYVSGGWSDSLYLFSYVALGLMALEPSVREITAPPPPFDVTLSRRRLGLLAIAALVTPGMLAVQWVRGAELTVPLVVGGTVVSFLLVVARMSGLVQALESSRAQLRFEATHDVLTGLPNRQLFNSRLDAVLRRGEAGALVFVDLDRFKAINDTLGHHEGDRVLVEVAQLLQAAVRGTDTVARLAGDEFVVLIPCEDEVEVLDIAQRLVRTVRVTRIAGHEPIVVTLSVGLARWSAHTGPEHADQLLKAADDAMYDAKRTAGGALVVAAV